VHDRVHCREKAIGDAIALVGAGRRDLAVIDRRFVATMLAEIAFGPEDPPPRIAHRRVATDSEIEIVAADDESAIRGGGAEALNQVSVVGRDEIGKVEARLTVGCALRADILALDEELERVADIEMAEQVGDVMLAAEEITPEIAVLRSAVAADRERRARHIGADVIRLTFAREIGGEIEI